MHRVPEPAVIQHPRWNLGEPVRSGGRPPLGEPQLRRRGHDPVQCRQPQIGAHRRARVAPPGTNYRVDDPGHIQPVQNPPHRGAVTEPQMPGPLGKRRGLARVQQFSDVRRSAQVTFGNHFRFPVNPGHLPQIPVRPPADHFLIQSHTIGHTLLADNNRPTRRETRGSRPGQTIKTK